MAGQKRDASVPGRGVVGGSRGRGGDGGYVDYAVLGFGVGGRCSRAVGGGEAQFEGGFVHVAEFAGEAFGGPEVLVGEVLLPDLILHAQTALRPTLQRVRPLHRSVVSISGSDMTSWKWSGRTTKGSVWGPPRARSPGGWRTEATGERPGRVRNVLPSEAFGRSSWLR
jgi:hypothetical protein